MFFPLPKQITVHHSIVWNGGHFEFDPSYQHMAESNFPPYLKM